MRKDRVEWGAATGTWKDFWKKLKMLLKSKTKKRHIEEYQEKRLQSETYRGQDERCNQWLECPFIHSFI